MLIKITTSINTILYRKKEKKKIERNTKIFMMNTYNLILEIINILL
jgi:hypothetical protein